MTFEPLLTAYEEGPLLLWRLPSPALAISSAVLGGGIGVRSWVVNATVPLSYDRDDPAEHLREMAAGLGLAGPGVGLLTGVDVASVSSASDSGVRVWATVGLGNAVQAAAAPSEVPLLRPGTINVVAWVPRRLSMGALVNAVGTVTEAKTQAVRDRGLPATGTSTDAVCILCPVESPEEAYGGPRSYWGSRLARAVHAAVMGS